MFLSFLPRLAVLCRSRSLSTQIQSAHCAPYPQRTHVCAAISAANTGSRVVLTGWLLAERKGKLNSFFPLRDSSGTVQLIVNHSNDNPHLEALSNLPVESSVLIEGTVLLRPPDAQRPVPGGDIDVQVDKVLVLNPADERMPFLPSNSKTWPNEDLRLRYRYLDLRRPSMTSFIKKRSQVARIVRDALYEKDFTEVETPVLLRSSPEGAREYLVPSRVKSESRPTFYALQQSPQQPKQLLICSGAVDRYFQIAKCFRDEDGRKDRQPEFTQVDMEMAYVSWGPLSSHAQSNSHAWNIGGGEIRDVVESIVRRIWLQVASVELPQRFPVMTYHDAMCRFGSDKPDTRFGLEIADLTKLLHQNVRSQLELKGLTLECLVIRKSSDPHFLAASATCGQTPSVESLRITAKNLSSWLGQTKMIRELLGAEATHNLWEHEDIFPVLPGDLIHLSLRPYLLKGGYTQLGRHRLKLLDRALASSDFKLTETPHFLWVTEFPLFTRSDDDKEFLARGRWSSSHHPFTAPMWEDVGALYDGRIESVRGQHYDLVLNGVEIGGGSVRVHDSAMQEHIFSHILQLTKEEQEPFQHLLHALRCGAPPHGGIALGFDRLMSLLCGTASIRDVIAFPKNSGGLDLLFQSPAPVDPKVWPHILDNHTATKE